MTVRTALLAAALSVLPAYALRAETGPAAAFVVFFTEWSGALDDAANKVIADAARAASANPSVPVTVTAYADNTGSPPANVALTQLRALRVRDTLAADGVPASRVAIVARGALPVAGVVGRRVEIAIGAAPAAATGR